MSASYWSGEKISLRSIEPSDSEILFKWSQDHEAMKDLDFVWPPLSSASLKSRVADQASKQSYDDSYTWIIEDSAKIPVGILHSHTCNPKNGTFSYGVFIEQPHRRHGYAREAIVRVLRYYFNELRYQKVTIAIVGGNPSSVYLHQKLGFKLEGKLRRMVYSNGRYHDLCYFGLLATELGAPRDEQAKPAEVGFTGVAG